MKRRLTYWILFFLLFANYAKTFGQQVPTQNLLFIDGRNIKETDYSGIEGSPYLFDDWSKGIVKLTNGKSYKDVPLKYDQADDVLYFQGPKGETLTFVVPVCEFRFLYVKDDQSCEKFFKNGFKNIKGYTENTFFEVLSDGTAQLIKKSHKYVIQSPGIALGTVTKKFNERENYYLIVSGIASELKRDKKSILTLLGNKQAALESYIKINSLNLKDDVDLAKLINYYNSI